MQIGTEQIDKIGRARKTFLQVYLATKDCTTDLRSHSRLSVNSRKRSGLLRQPADHLPEVPARRKQAGLPQHRPPAVKQPQTTYLSVQ